jgi:hypothetical protein
MILIIDGPKHIDGKTPKEFRGLEVSIKGRYINNLEYCFEKLRMLCQYRQIKLTMDPIQKNSSNFIIRSSCRLASMKVLIDQISEYSLIKEWLPAQ